MQGFAICETKVEKQQGKNMEKVDTDKKTTDTKEIILWIFVTILILVLATIGVLFIVPQTRVSYVFFYLQRKRCAD